MKRITTYISLCLVLCLALLSYAQVKFDSISAWKLNNELASDKFEGRKSGSAGGERTAEWIASKFKEWGLEPAGVNGTYFAPFHLLVTEDLPFTKLELINGRKGKVVYSLGDDYAILTNSGSGRTASEVIFVGYGISEPSKGRDDYAGIDVKGKIVLVLVGAPSKGNWSEERLRGYKIKKAGEKGASGVLLVSGDRPVRGGAIQEKYYQPQLPAVWVGSKIVHDIFFNTGLDYNAIKSQLDSAPQSFNTGKMMYIEANVVKREGTSKNVVAMIRGVDPKWRQGAMEPKAPLKDTYIVVGAHMDHTGKDSEGNIYHGADDNASGTAVVMELARVMMANHVKPKRSILFILFAGEEQGLLGSKAFVDSPTVDREKIMLMLNLDMVGRGNGNISLGGMENYPREWRLIEPLIPDTLRKRMGKFRAGEGSDHYSFADKGIPAFFLVTSGSHPEYHQTSDTGDKIQPFVLGVAGNIAYDVILYMANYEGDLYDKDRFYKYEYHRADVVNLDDCTKMQTMSDSQFVLRAKDLLAAGEELYICPLSSSKTAGLESLMSEYTRLSKVIEKNSDFLGFAKSSTEVSGINGSQKLAVTYSINSIANFLLHPSLLFPLEKLGVKFICISNDDLETLFSSNILNDVGRKFISGLSGINVILDMHSRNVQRVASIVGAVSKPVVVHFSLTDEINTTDVYADSLIAKKGVLVVDCGDKDLTDSDMGKIEKLVNKFTADNIMLNLGNDNQIAPLERKLELMKIEPEKMRRMFGRNIIGLLQ